MIKNLEVRSIIRLFPFCAFIRLMIFLFFVLHGKNEYALPILSGFWNSVLNFRRIYEKRKHVQQMRKLADDLVLRPSLLLPFTTLPTMFFAEILPIVQRHKR
jgi:hypothetical protein